MSVVHAGASEKCEAAIETVIVSAKVNMSDRGHGSLYIPGCKCMQQLVMWHSRRLSDVNANMDDHGYMELYTPMCKSKRQLVTWHPCQLKKKMRKKGTNK